MERELNTIKLTDYEVDIVTYLTWGERETIQNALLKGADFGAIKDGSSPEIKFDASVMLEAKYTALETCIKAIRKGDEVVTFSREWMNVLRVEDGDKLYEAVDAVGKKK